MWLNWFKIRERLVLRCFELATAWCSPYAGGWAHYFWVPNYVSLALFKIFQFTPSPRKWTGSDFFCDTFFRHQNTIDAKSFQLKTFGYLWKLFPRRSLNLNQTNHTSFANWNPCPETESLRNQQHETFQSLWDKTITILLPNRDAWPSINELLYVFPDHA